LSAGVFNLVVLVCVLRTTTKKKVVNFFRTKVHLEENHGYAYDLLYAVEKDALFL